MLRSRPLKISRKGSQFPWLMIRFLNVVSEPWSGECLSTARSRKYFMDKESLIARSASRSERPYKKLRNSILNIRTGG